ncbi:MAG: xanthine dehydrogenase family protein subunit M [Rhodobacteraceae bacterium]|nr:xanthine dehydrogenase family protein subunit M [Paracoccaceae bacterium]
MKYEAPSTIDDAIALLADAQAAASVLSGGTDLLVRMRADMAAPGAIVDIKRIPALNEITETADGWRIGAAVPSAVMSEHDGLARDWPGVVEAAALIGSTQVQGRATLAGNLCNASPAADSVPAMVAASAKVEIAGPGGTRTVPVEEIPTGPGKTSLAAGEFVTAILLPKRAALSGDAYLRFIPRTEMDIAVAGCGIALSLDDTGTCQSARVALGAVGPTVILAADAASALIGTKLDDAALEALAAACSAAATPIDDKRGTAAYRKHVIGVLAKRAAKIAYARAGETA